MTRLLYRAAFLFLVCLVTAAWLPEDHVIDRKKQASEGAKRLLLAYPDFVARIEDNKVWFHDGTSMLYDDGEDKLLDTMLMRPDIEDMMALPYRGDDTPAFPTKQDAAGRVRNEAFLKKMYGNTEDEVRGNLRQFEWLPGIDGQLYRFNTHNGAADSLEKVIAELVLLPDSLHKYMKNPAGVFKWRKLAGSERMSMHSFGIALDLNIKYADYWNWIKDPITREFKYNNRYPLEIVRIFEKYGFIWGGRWFNHDTMHFEFRPDLLLKLEAEKSPFAVVLPSRSLSWLVGLMFLAMLAIGVRWFRRRQRS